jgi:acetyl esterase/lipase
MASIPMKALTLSLLAILSGASLSAQDRFSDEQMQKYLQRYPDADTDKDGKLSREEATTYLRKLRGGEGGNPKKRASAAPAPDHADVAYGTHPNNRLDLWLAKSDKPTPLIVFIHGGGFVGGDKSSVSGSMIKQALDHGVSIASINYRFRTEASINVVLRDCARAVQFLRVKADEWHFDKTKIAAMGGSAGAGTSLWLAFHDDLADPKEEDPVLRESTRLTAAASNSGQASYDIKRWREVLGSDEAMRFYPQVEWPKMYGLGTLEDLDSDEGKRLRADADMLGLISKDDPPVMLSANSRHNELNNKGDTNHTAKHSEAVRKRCDEIGVVAVLHIMGGGGSPDDAGGGAMDFLLEKLGAMLAPAVSAIPSTPPTKP